MEVNMIAVPIKLCRLVQIMAVATILVIFPGIAFTQCLALKEEGEWRTLKKPIRIGDTVNITVKMISCGDQVLNDVPTETRWTVRPVEYWSSGRTYRPPLEAFFQQWKGQRWLRAKMNVGGYIKHYWMRTEPQPQPDGSKLMHVFVVYESLDQKPNATEEFWFTNKIRRLGRHR
jgi:hypothetical protein